MDIEGKNLYKLNKLFTCDLGSHFTAYNMSHGPFGLLPSSQSVDERDLICVQSMDGRLSFFEGSVHAFTRRLNNCLVPGPLCYIPRVDGFVTVSSQMTVEMYKYQVLASSQSDGTESREKKAGEKDGNEDENDKKATVSAVKKVTVDWGVLIGEDVISVSCARITSKGSNNNSSDIVVLGHHHLFTISETGQIKSQMRLDFDPSCLSTYARQHKMAGVGDNFILGDFDTGSLHIYRNTRKVWSAKMDSPAILAKVGDFGPHKGMMVTVSDDGRLSIGYLGTTPPSSSVVSEGKEINYDEIDEEHRKLLGIIRASQSDTRLEPKDKIILRYQIPKSLDRPGAAHELDGGGEHILQKCVKQDGGLMQLTVKLFVSYSGTSDLKNVNININSPDCVLTRNKSIKVATLKGGTSTPMIMDIVFYANANILPCNTEVFVSLIYLTSSGEPRTAKCTIDLPMFFLARLIPPVKEPTYKFTLETNKPPVLLATLFEDLFVAMGEHESGQAAGNNANYVLSFRYWMTDSNNNRMNATIMLSKNAGRYRVQSHNLGALWYVASELTKRLGRYFEAIASAGGEGGLELSYTEPLPLTDFYSSIDDHFRCRQELLERKSLLNDCAQQFRTIEKRLLVRFKDRNAVPLQNLDVIMSETYHRLLELASHVEQSQNMLAISQNFLACSTSLLLLLVKLRFNLDDANFAELSCHLTPNVTDNDENGWEECVDAAMTHLLRTVLAKNQSEGNTNRSNELAMPVDTSKLKKHISIVCDRLHKGDKLVKENKNGDQ